VKTIVRKSPIRSARRTAAWKRLEDADREEDDGERVSRRPILPHKQVSNERLRNEAAAEAVEREQRGQAHHDPSGAVKRGQRLRFELLTPLDRGRKPGGREQSRCCGERVGEQPPRRRADECDQRAERAGEGRDRVVRAEEAGGLAAGMGQHRLLERGERPRFDDIGRDGARQGRD
jgi:hypothetical protein